MVDKQFTGMSQEEAFGFSYKVGMWRSYIVYTSFMVPKGIYFKARLEML